MLSNGAKLAKLVESSLKFGSAAVRQQVRGLVDRYRL